jgi:type VI secretion system protein ImpL
VERASLTSELKPGAALCARAVANRYPFAATATSDVLPEDFGELFGVDGTFDLMFKRRLAPLVDTSVRPWKYKALADGVRPASSAALLNFERAAMIRDAFFKRGGKSPAFRVEVRVVEWSDGLDSLFLDIDGQVHKFDPASDTALAIAWPGTPVSSRIKMYTTMQDQAQTFEGPWALFRFFDRFEIQRTAQPEKFAVLVHVDGKRARLEVTASSVINPFQMPEMQLFRCPGA